MQRAGARAVCFVLTIQLGGRLHRLWIDRDDRVQRGTARIVHFDPIEIEPGQLRAGQLPGGESGMNAADGGFLEMNCRAGCAIALDADPLSIAHAAVSPMSSRIAIPRASLLRSRRSASHVRSDALRNRASGHRCLANAHDSRRDVALYQVRDALPRRGKYRVAHLPLVGALD